MNIFGIGLVCTLLFLFTAVISCILFFEKKHDSEEVYHIILGFLGMALGIVLMVVG